MVERISFHDQIQKNKLKSVLLIISIFLAFIILGYIISIVLGPSYFFIIMMISIIFSISYTIFGFYNSHKIALASVNAKPANKIIHRNFFDVVENMSLASGLPMPKLYVMESSQINAFASGRNPENAVICCTTGCLEKLNKKELEGVIAHEMAHIANFDIRFMTLTAILIGSIAILSEIFLRSLWFSSTRSERDKSGAIFLIIGIILAILAPIVTHLISLAISRKREFVADSTAVKFTRYSPGLASALRKIKSESISSQDKHKYSKAVAPLFISDPFKSKIQGLFSTHPSIDERIKKLEKM